MKIINKREKHTGKFNFFSKNFADHGFGSGSALQRHIRIRSQGANWMQIYSMWIRMRNTGSSFPLPTLYFVSILYTVRRSSSLCASLVHSRVLFPWGNPHRETPLPIPHPTKLLALCYWDIFPAVIVHIAYWLSQIYFIQSNAWPVLATFLSNRIGFHLYSFLYKLFTPFPWSAPHNGFTEIQSTVYLAVGVWST
jgi:hypothetical protein